MTPIADYQLPDPDARFMPRKQESILSALIQTAWADYVETTFPPAEREQVAEELARMLESTPPADLDTLRRYGFTETRGTASVRMFNCRTDRWDQTAGIDLPRPVEVPKGGGFVTALGVRWSRQNGRGVTPAYRAELEAEGRWEAFCAEQDKREAEMVPEHLNGFFRRIVEARNAERDHYREASAWPAAVKAETGSYPFWREIEARFPFIGDYLAKRRGAVLASAVAA